jgi:PAS domain S-box-containing protein
MPKPTSGPPAQPLISARAGLFLVVLLVSLASLTAGLFVADRWIDGREVWFPVVVLLALDTVCIVLAWTLVDADGALRPRAVVLDELAPCGHFALDAGGRILRAGGAALAWLGYAEEDVVGRPFADLIASPDGAFDPQAAAHDVELQLRRRDGGLFAGSFSSRVVSGLDGKALFTSVLFVDVTERKNSERRLAELSARLDAVLSAATQLAIVAYDLDGLVIAFSPGAERLLGHRATDMIGREGPPCLHLASELNAHAERLQKELGRPVGAFEALVWRARQEGHDEREWTYLRKDGGALTVRLTLTPIRGPDGQPRGYLAVAADVTERRRAAELQRAAHDAALAANQAKSNFLASMSHEIRTPLTGIIGMIELLQQTPVDQQQRGYLDSLGRSAETLLALINDVLDITKVEAGKLELEEAPFDLRELAHQATSVVSAQAERKGLTLTCDVTPEVPRRVVGDAGRLRQVLLNLLANAVRFTERGGVALRASAGGGGEATSGPISFSVTDTGIGIAEDKLSLIFEPFAQADASTARTHGGTGLGLTIASRLVERMGGRLAVVSAPGQGSTFSFTLALPRAEAKAEPPAVLERPAAAFPLDRPIRVLLAEDNPVNQEVMMLLLRNAGYQVGVAANGEEALAAFEKEPFDLILMDVQMPGMDGLRATRLIRAREKAVGGRVPIVAVTANALSGERQRCLAAGMDEYLAKPIRGAELFPLIERLVGGGAEGAASPESAAEEPADWLATLTGMGFEPGAIARLTRTFLDTVPPRLILLRQALAEGNALQVQMTAHSLKGSLAVFGAKEATETAQRLEALGQQQRLEGGNEVLTELDARVGPLLEAMQAYARSSP